MRLPAWRYLFFFHRILLAVDLDLLAVNQRRYGDIVIAYFLLFPC